MRLRIRTIASVLAGFAVSLALMAYDEARDAGWAVTAAQIADARAFGKPGVEIGPGTFAATPVPAQDAALLPVKWVLCGLAVGLAVAAATGRRPAEGASRTGERDRTHRDR